MSSRGAAALILGVIAVLFAAASGCSDDGTTPTTPPVSKLRFTVISAAISANLQPIVPPDPIGASVVVAVSNLTGDSLTQVTIPGADVVLADSARTLGRIDFSSMWDGQLGPFETDTVTITKINAATTLFGPRCGERVLLKMTGQLDGVNDSFFESDTLIFGCVF